jgi:hypothetical protein
MRCSKWFSTKADPTRVPARGEAELISSDMAETTSEEKADKYRSAIRESLLGLGIRAASRVGPVKSHKEIILAVSLQHHQICDAQKGLPQNQEVKAYAPNSPRCDFLKRNALSELYQSLTTQFLLSTKDCSCYSSFFAPYNPCPLRNDSFAARCDQCRKPQSTLSTSVGVDFASTWWDARKCLDLRLLWRRSLVSRYSLCISKSGGRCQEV